MIASLVGGFCLPLTISARVVSFMGSSFPVSQVFLSLLVSEVEVVWSQDWTVVLNLGAWCLPSGSGPSCVVFPLSVSEEAASESVLPLIEEWPPWRERHGTQPLRPSWTRSPWRSCDGGLSATWGLCSVTQPGISRRGSSGHCTEPWYRVWASRTSRPWETPWVVVFVLQICLSWLRDGRPVCRASPNLRGTSQVRRGVSWISCLVCVLPLGLSDRGWWNRRWIWCWPGCT